MGMPVREPGQEIREVAANVSELPSFADVTVQVDEAIGAIVREADGVTDPAQAALRPTRKPGRTSPPARRRLPLRPPPAR
jgi:hypothetical protein